MQANKYFFHFIFVIFVFLFSFGAGKEVLAAISPDGCVSWDTYCVNSSITADLSWNALTQADINEIRSDCTLQSVNYTVNIIGLGTRNAGAATSYTWTGLAENTTYQWRVRADYQCTIAWRSGLIWTDTYSFTTTVCNQPPTAAISCDPSNCQQYYGSPLILVNDSTDPDGDGDIVVSKWYKKLQGEPDTSYELLSYCDCTYKCDCTPQAEVTPGSYTAKLYIEDSVGQPSTATENFQIFKDAEAGFMCSLDNRNWRSCEEIKPSGGELVYFRDDPALPEYSTFSQGATSINQRIWRLNSQVFDSDNNPNPSLALNQTSNIIELTITDNQGRTDSVSHTISTGIPLPEWKEIPPF